MKGKTTYSLKPPLTKRPSEVGYWKLDEKPESGECLRQNHNMRKDNMRKLWQTSKVKMGEQSIKSIKSCKQAKGGLLQIRKYTRGRRMG